MSSETSVSYRNTTRRHNTEDVVLNLHYLVQKLLLLAQSHEELEFTLLYPIYL